MRQELISYLKKNRGKNLTKINPRLMYISERNRFDLGKCDILAGESTSSEEGTRVSGIIVSSQDSLSELTERLYAPMKWLNTYRGSLYVIGINQDTLLMNYLRQDKRFVFDYGSFHYIVAVPQKKEFEFYEYRDDVRTIPVRSVIVPEHSSQSSTNAPPLSFFSHISIDRILESITDPRFVDGALGILQKKSPAFKLARIAYRAYISRMRNSRT